jgi:arsenate reductase
VQTVVVDASEWVIWANPQCSKSRGAEQLLAERGVVPTRVLYLQEPPSRAELEAMLVKLGTDDPRALVRTGEPEYAGLETATREELLDALVRHPRLIERPVVARGDRAVVARPPDRLLELLDQPDDVAVP